MSWRASALRWLASHDVAFAKNIYSDQHTDKARFDSLLALAEQRVREAAAEAQTALYNEIVLKGS